MSGTGHNRYDQALRSARAGIGRLAVSGIAVGSALMSMVIPQASAEPSLNNDESSFVNSLAEARPPIGPTPGHTSWELAQMGHQIGNDVTHGVDPFTETTWLQLGNPGIGSPQAVTIVRNAVRVFAPAYARWYYDCGSGAVCGEPRSAFWPPGAVHVPWNANDPGMPPLLHRVCNSYQCSTS
jgi:hypothetical protein